MRGRVELFLSANAADSLASRHLVRTVLELPTIAMVAKFQHWAYTHPELGGNPKECDKYWAQLWNRFVPGVDFEGYEEDISLQWREVFQIFAFPFYYIEYAIAYLAAIQIRENYRRYPKLAINKFREALRKGRTISVQQFFEIANIKFPSKTQDLSDLAGSLITQIHSN